MINKYQRQINLLDMMINQWNWLSEIDVNSGHDVQVNGHSFDLVFGLCHNAELYDIESVVLNNAFKSWEHYSGYHSYPVGGINEYMQNENKFTVERLRLAKHVRSHLMLAGVPKPSLEEKVSTFFDSNFNAGVAAILIILVIVYAIFSNI